MKKFHQRKSRRLQDYDYSQAGAYFATICSYRREHIFGDIRDGEMSLNWLGEIVNDDIPRIPSYWEHVDIDYYVVMPNHVHVIVIIDDIVQPTNKPKPTLGRIIGNYKGGVTRQARKHKAYEYDTIWQINFHEHIIRDETDLNRIRHYIVNNSVKWSDDLYYG